MKFTDFIHTWFLRHLQVAISSLGRLWQTPVASAMTISVIAITLSLPAALHLVIDNLRSVSGSWEDSARISLFLNAETDHHAATELAGKIGKRPDIAHIEIISPEAALEEFRAHSGFADALQALDENPLPGVLVISPSSLRGDTVAIQQMVRELRELPGVDLAQLDMEWLQRLAAMMDIAERAVQVIAALLGLAILLIIGNTIRLDIQNRRAEIEITKLIGATNAFVRRPFLYSGLWLGLLGGLLAWILTLVALWLLQGPVAQLATLYRSGFELAGPGILILGILILGGTLLGLAGAWISVGRHLNAIEPA